MSNSQKVIEWRKRTKELLMQCLGGKCNRCGYDRCKNALDFHHLRDKNFNLSKGLSSPSKRETLVEETKKCILLCANCHKELHAYIWSINDIEIFIFDEKICEELGTLIKKECICGKSFNRSDKRIKYCSDECYRKNISEKDRIIRNQLSKEVDKECVCQKCSKIIEYKGKIQKYCSNTCATEAKRKVVRPSKEELEKMLWEKPMIHVAIHFGVSDAAVHKWAKKYGITKPKNGYWLKPENRINPNDVIY